MDNLMEKALTCYKKYLTNLNCGVTDQCYDMLYNALIYNDSGLNNQTYYQYFFNNLKCGGSVTPTIGYSGDVISIAVSSEETIDNTFEWDELEVSEPRIYTLVSQSIPGYNYVYISVPNNKNFKITDALGNILYDSTSQGNYSFEYAGKITTDNNRTNKAYKKTNVFNTINPVKFNVELI